ncbi:MAG: hypothetical protein HY593_02620, partial [Candidatus Omnitrophica bacterium]|nr:hypothetical protein [Candidatus Omnitrophota bacterium]
VSHIYTAAISSELSKQFFLTTSFSIQTARTWVPADSTRTEPNGASVPIQFVVPPFDADVYTWLLDCDYVLKENLTFVGSFRYSAADNFDDFESLRVTFFGGFYGIGLPLGASYKQADVSLGLRWLPKENWTVEPRYGLYHYDANEAVETGDYTAHVVSFQVSSKWG